RVALRRRRRPENIFNPALHPAQGLETYFHLIGTDRARVVADDMRIGHQQEFVGVRRMQFAAANQKTGAEPTRFAWHANQGNRATALQAEAVSLESGEAIRSEHLFVSLICFKLARSCELGRHLSRRKVHTTAFALEQRIVKPNCETCATKWE